MSDKVYRTNQGKEIDLGKLILKNESVRAVGNMNVNARGDVIDSGNKNVANRNKQVSKTYRKQIGGLVKDMPVMNSQKAAQLIANKYVASAFEDEIAGLDKPAVKVEEAPVAKEAAPVDAIETALEKTEAKATGGLAGAIAKAREVKQESLPTPREEERGQTGVKKI